MVRHAEIMQQSARVVEAPKSKTPQRSPGFRSPIAHIMATYFEVGGKWLINDKGEVDVIGNCTMKPSAFATPNGKFLVTFGKIDGHFFANNCKLRSLDGAPNYVEGRFECNQNKLTSLSGSPSHVGWSFACDMNELTDLKGCPKAISGNYSCIGNPLKSLEGLPTEISGGDFNFTWTADLPLLRLVGKSIYIHGGDRDIGSVIEEIINDYVESPSRANIIACQRRLIDAGFAGNAAW